MTSRWKQRYENYIRALARLEVYVAKETLTELEEPGFIQTFEFVCELAWNTIKDFYEDQGMGSFDGTLGIQGSKDAIRLAVQRGMIRDGKAWFRLLKDRNLTSHTYHEELAKSVAENIRNEYIVLFRELAETLAPAFNQEEDR
jgi:nucleotidyltransferase substrate binding protein (TIGR01987 family)